MEGDLSRHWLFSAVLQWIARAGLNAPVIFFLELHRPLAFAAGQCAIFFQPVLTFFLSVESAQRLANWLSDDDGLDQMIHSLHTGEL